MLNHELLILLRHHKTRSKDSRHAIGSRKNAGLALNHQVLVGIGRTQDVVNLLALYWTCSQMLLACGYATPVVDRVYAYCRLMRFDLARCLHREWRSALD